VQYHTFIEAIYTNYTQLQANNKVTNCLNKEIC